MCLNHDRIKFVRGPLTNMSDMSLFSQHCLPRLAEIQRVKFIKGSGHRMKEL